MSFHLIVFVIFDVLVYATCHVIFNSVFVIFDVHVLVYATCHVI